MPTFGGGTLFGKGKQATSHTLSADGVQQLHQGSAAVPCMAETVSLRLHLGFTSPPFMKPAWRMLFFTLFSCTLQQGKP